MCGIAGIVAPQGVRSELAVTMANAIRHRGPDDEGYVVLTADRQLKSFKGNDTHPSLVGLSFIDESENTQCVLAHRRLSILDLSVAGHQPLLSADGRHALVYNGEIYNHVALRRLLEEKGHHFTSDCDTEVVLRALMEWGEEAVTRFRGMWAFAWLNLENQSLLLSRDRFGIKPLYYSDYGGKLSFASEIKALLAAGLLPRVIKRNRLFEYLALGAMYEPYEEPFASLKSVAPGTHVKVGLADLRLEIKPYYNLEHEVELCAQNPGTAADFGAWLEESVQLHMGADVEVGTCLSGGLDSSAIVAASAKIPELSSMRAFTAVFPGYAEDEGRYARMVCDSFPVVQSVEILPTAQGLLADLDRMIYHQDLPIGSTSVFAQWEVMKQAGKSGVKVLLDGQGADEVLGGYLQFAGLRLLGLLKRGRFKTFRREYAWLRNRLTPKMLKTIARAAYYHLPENMQRRIRRQQRVGSHLIAPEWRKQWNMAEPDRGGRDFTAHSLRSMRYGLYELLRYEDRNSMAFGIESRVPFLDHHLVARSIALPEEQKMFEGWSKYPVRHYLNGKVPNDVTWRTDKKGFVTPQMQWKEQLAPHIQRYLAQCDFPAELNADYFRQLAARPVQSPAHLSEFWRAYSVLRWMESNNLAVGD